MCRKDSGLAAPRRRGFSLPLLLLLLPLVLVLLLQGLPLPRCWLLWYLVLVEGIRRKVSISAQRHCRDGAGRDLRPASDSSLGSYISLDSLL